MSVSIRIVWTGTGAFFGVEECFGERVVFDFQGRDLSKIFKKIIN